MSNASERQARMREIGRQILSENLCSIVNFLRDGIASNHREIDELIDYILEKCKGDVAKELESEIRQALFVLRANVSSAFNLASGGSDDGIRSAFNACHASEPILLALAARVEDAEIQHDTDDTKHDKAKKTSEKKTTTRPITVEATDCGRLFKAAKRKDSTTTRIQVVSEYVEQHGGSVDSIERTLSAHPELWKETT